MDLCNIMIFVNYFHKHSTIGRHNIKTGRRKINRCLNQITSSELLAIKRPSGNTVKLPPAPPRELLPQWANSLIGKILTNVPHCWHNRLFGNVPQTLSTMTPGTVMNLIDCRARPCISPIRFECKSWCTCKNSFTWQTHGFYLPSR